MITWPDKLWSGIARYGADVPWRQRPSPRVWLSQTHIHIRRMTEVSRPSSMSRSSNPNDLQPVRIQTDRSEHWEEGEVEALRAVQVWPKKLKWICFVRRWVFFFKKSFLTLASRMLSRNFVLWILSVHVCPVEFEKNHIFLISTSHYGIRIQPFHVFWQLENLFREPLSLQFLVLNFAEI